MAQKIGANKNNFIRNQNQDNISCVDSGGSRDILTIKESSRLIFFVSKFFGYSLFTLPKVNLKNHKICRNFKIKTTFVDFAIFVTVILVYVYLIYYNAVTHFDIGMSASLILSMGGQICLTIGLIVSTAAIILCFLRRETVFKIFINLCYIDIVLETFHDSLVVQVPEKLKNVNASAIKATPQTILNHKKHFKVSMWFLVLGLIIISSDLAATYVLINIEFNSNSLVYVSYALQNTSFWMITSQTVLFLFAIKARYRALNKLICCYLSIQDEPSHPEVEKFYDLETFSDNRLALPINSTFLRSDFRFDRKIMAEFAQIHDKLNDVVEWINGCYAIQCLGVVAVSFGYVILAFFSLYYALYHPHNETSQLATVYQAWYIFYIFCVISIIIASWTATAEGNQTGVLLHKSINQIMIDPHIEIAQSNEIIDSLRIFSLQLQKRSPVVSCGLFTYDWTLLFSIIASSTTYLIILIQFDSSVESLTCDTNKTGILE